MKDYILDLDKPRELRFGFKALRLIRGKFGDRNIDQLMNIQIDEIPKLVWAGLKWEQPSLTVEQLEDLLDEAIPGKHTIMEIINLTLGALAAQMGVDPKKALADVKKKEIEKAKEAEKPEKKEVTETIPSSKKPKK